MGNANSGRRPKPTAIRVLEGNRSKTPIPNDPNFRPTLPECPDWMPELGQEMWAKLLAHLGFVTGLLTEADWLIMELACKCYARWRECEAFVDKNGLAYEAFILLDTEGKPVSADLAKVTRKAMPEILIGERARKAMDGYLSRLGLSPADRVRLATPRAKRDETGLLDVG